MSLRQVILVTHRWLGLSAATVLFIVGATGAALVWWHAPLLGRLHTGLLLRGFGRWLVIGSTIASLLLAIGGLVLWWRRKILTTALGEGWWRITFDLHHLVGLVGCLLMLLIAATGLGLVLVPEGPRRPDRGSGLAAAPVTGGTKDRRLRKRIHSLHTARPYGWPIQALYVLGSAAFAFQAVSGFVMWWKPKRIPVPGEEP